MSTVRTEQAQKIRVRIAGTDTWLAFAGWLVR